MSSPSPDIDECRKKILAAMEAGRALAVQELAGATGLSMALLQQQLPRMVDARLVDRQFNGKRYHYSLPQSSNHDPEKSARMSGHLVGYDQRIQQFRELCMLTRSPIAALGKPETGKRPAGKLHTAAEDSTTEPVAARKKSAARRPTRKVTSGTTS